jgi:hypothetical protein
MQVAHLLSSGTPGTDDASPREMADEMGIFTYKHQFFSRPLGFEVSEAICISTKNGVIDGYEYASGQVGEKSNDMEVNARVGEGHSTQCNEQDSSGLGGGKRSSSGARVKTYAVVSGLMVPGSLPVQVGDQVAKLNGQAVSSWSFQELTHKLKHLPLPLTLEFMKTSQHVLQVTPPPPSRQRIHPRLSMGTFFLLAFV